jgi:2-dehydropantoate 2-reductase
MSREPELVIVGTGAMACLFGARLSLLARVTLLGTWQEGLAAIQQGGIRFVNESGGEQVFDVQATQNVGQCAGARHAVVLVKSWQTPRAARQLAECLAEEGVALTLQNGLGNLECLQRQLGSERSALGVTTCGATLLGPGRVRLGGLGPTHLSQHPRLGWMADLFKAVGFEVQVAGDLRGLLWGKLAINSAINPLTALLRVANGELLADAHRIALMKAAADETRAVAEALGIDLPHADPGAAAVAVAERTAANHSSMLQDVLRGAPTEIDAICGAIVEEGARLGVATPVNWVLWHLIHSLRPAAAVEADT